MTDAADGVTVPTPAPERAVAASHGAPAPPDRARARADGLPRTLTIGGVLLIVSAVAAFAAPNAFAVNLPFHTVLSWVSTAAFSASVLVFALGIGQGGSIVARRPLGVTAALVVALWPFAERALTWAMPFSAGTAEFYQVWGYVSLTVRIAAAVVLVVQIARAGVVTGRMRWVPAWALAVVVLPQLLVQVMMVALGADLGRTEPDGLYLLIGLGQLASFAAPVTLGILAIVLAQRRPTPSGDAVQIYPPAG
ncbi:hypothetical protein GCM10025760_26670 [Microbacterium yannicii]|uniref:Uncharacterized protein n=1 Tax=Microbacterium yannicii TaxID=671622 RepID=A0ABP9ME12_9MICO|nr:hypothetical protein [Microbacterium yannicii]MCO5953044.1 hypothetical protein [Microbacterium yannicii]